MMVHLGSQTAMWCWSGSGRVVAHVVVNVALNNLRCPAATG